MAIKKRRPPPVYISHNPIFCKKNLLNSTAKQPFYTGELMVVWRITTNINNIIAHLLSSIILTSYVCTHIPSHQHQKIFSLSLPLSFVIFSSAFLLLDWLTKNKVSFFGIANQPTATEEQVHIIGKKSWELDERKLNFFSFCRMKNMTIVKKDGWWWLLAIIFFAVSLFSAFSLSSTF